MFRDYFANKWIIGCFSLLIVISVSCIIWYRYETGKHRKALHDVTEYVLQREVNRKTNIKAASKERTVLSIENSVTTADEDVIDDISLGVTIPNQKEQPKELENTDNLRVSPLGFGPYPEIPSDYSLRTPIWLRKTDMIPNHADLPFEIMDRVLIKLWNQGHKNITGASYSPNEGKVYPYFANTAYVSYRQFKLPDGTVQRYITRVRGGADIAPYFKQIKNGTAPDFIKVIDYESAGIDPYTFLK